MASVMSTALSRLNAFLDSELEQLLCFDTEIDAEQFCSQSAPSFLPRRRKMENQGTSFAASLLI